MSCVASIKLDLTISDCVGSIDSYWPLMLSVLEYNTEVSISRLDDVSITITTSAMYGKDQDLSNCRSQLNKQSSYVIAYFTNYFPRNNIDTHLRFFPCLSTNAVPL